MTVGEVLLESLSTGIITETEVGWLTSNQSTFNRTEEAAVLRLGRMIDDGEVNLGCRLSAPLLQHMHILNDWIEPLGRRRGNHT